MNRRIWELDAARGAALIGMIAIHFVYDLSDLYRLLPFTLPHWYDVFKNNYGAVFLLIAGISATLGSRPIKRGAQVFASGFLCTAVTYGMYRFGFADIGIVIYFGVLQCLGVCMILWAGLRRLPSWALILLGLSFAAVGLYLRGRSFDVSWAMIPLGFAPRWFQSSDYFPLLPNLGYFLLGAAAGRALYPTKVTRFPNVRPARLLCAMGKHSLLIYLLHQPILAAMVSGWILVAF